MTKKAAPLWARPSLKTLRAECYFTSRGLVRRCGCLNLALNVLSLEDFHFRSLLEFFSGGHADDVTGERGCEPVAALAVPL